MYYLAQNYGQNWYYRLIFGSLGTAGFENFGQGWVPLLQYYFQEIGFEWDFLVLEVTEKLVAAVAVVVVVVVVDAVVKVAWCVVPTVSSYPEIWLDIESRNDMVREKKISPN